jgi:hypothetical protein
MIPSIGILKKTSTPAMKSIMQTTNMITASICSSLQYTLILTVPLSKN